MNFADVVIRGFAFRRRQNAPDYEPRSSWSPGRRSTTRIVPFRRRARRAGRQNL